MGFLENKSVVFSWFLSYMLVLLLTISINLYAYMKIEENMFEQNSRYVVEILENYKQSIDNVKAFVSNTAIELSNNSDIREIALETKMFDQNMVYKTVEIREQLMNYKNLDFNFEDIYIYFHETDYIIGMNSNNNADFFYDIYFKDKNMSKNEWLHLMRKNHTGSFVDFSAKGEKSGQGNILYLYSIYGVERFRPYATIAIQINYSTIIREHSNNDLLKKFYILDGDNNIFMSRKNDDLTSINEIIHNNGICDGISEFGTNIMVVIPSESNNWKYVCIVERSVFRRNINYARLSLIICNLIGLSVVIFLAWILTKKNYKQVKNIMNILGDDANTDWESNEFEYINQKITNIIGENQEFNKLIKTEHGIIRDALLAKILNDSYPFEKRKEILNHLGLSSFEYDNFLIVLFYIETNPYMFFDNKNDDMEETYNLAKLVISNILRDMLNKDHVAYYCDIDGLLGCILNVKSEESYDELIKILERLQQFVLENFNIDFMAGVSQLHRTIDELPLCYNETMECMEYRLFGLKEIVEYKDIAQTGLSAYYFPRMKQEQLIYFLKTGDYAGCESVINEIFDKNFNNPVKSVSLAKCILYEFFATIMKAVNETGMDLDEDIYFADILNDINSTDVTLAAIKEKIENILKRFCEKNRNDNISRMAFVVEDVKKYINENYMDYNLTASIIAEKFNITLPYLSVMFKKYTQMGLLEYITKVRIDKAKEILDSTDCVIDDVAKMVGYTNARSFFRIFSKCVGVSPGKYRANAMVLKSDTVTQ